MRSTGRDKYKKRVFGDDDDRRRYKAVKRYGGDEFDPTEYLGQINPSGEYDEEM